MAIDTPAKIAVLGAGPLGLEAALYARFLGYDVEVFARGDSVAERAFAWEHVRMFSPFGMNRSTLGLAALEAHDSAFVPPGDEELLTYRQWADRYLYPLTQTDLLADHLVVCAEVLAVGKDEIWRNDLPGHEDRGDFDFRLFVRRFSGQEEMHKADAVLDATGDSAVPNSLGQGGIPAIGETSLRDRIAYDIPDVAGSYRTMYAGKHTLVVGSGHSAATTISNLAKLAEEAPGTRITWITRHEPAEGAGPVALILNDPLPQRERLALAANHLATAGGDLVAWWPATFIDQVSRKPTGEFHIVASGRHEGEFAFDEIIANVGHRRRDEGIFSELQSDPPEPNFYRLGVARRSATSHFLFSDGLARIREIFAIIGDRADLDLYAGAQKLVREAT